MAARSTWNRLSGDFDTAWRTLGPRLLVLLATSQRAAAEAAVGYVPRVLAEQGIDIEPEGRVRIDSFVGVASDGRPLETLLYQPVIHTKQLIGEGAGLNEAKKGGLAVLERIMQTQVADAGRSATGVGIAARPRVGYVRQIVTPSCGRCVVLAGKYYRWNDGFLRHPRCDCVHIPTVENRADDYTTNPRLAIEQGHVRGLSKADTRAIVDDGADVGQVINAKRGLKPGGITTEGTTRRAFAGRRMREAGDTFRGPTTSRYRRTTGTRLTPDAIYKRAADQAEALSLLRRYGYLV